MATSESQNKQLIECRICLQFCSELDSYNLFKSWTHPWNNEAALIADVLSHIANIKVLESDPHKYMCKTCHSELLEACIFVHTAQKSDGFLREKYPESYESWPQPIQVDKNKYDIEIKQELVNDEYEMNDAHQSSNEFQPVITEIKIEPEEFTESQLQNNLKADADEDLQATTNGPEYTDVEYLDVGVVKDEDCEMDDSTSLNSMPLDCLLCSKDFKSISGLKAHVIAQHSYKTVKRKADGESSPVRQQRNNHECLTCKRKFTTPTELLVHSSCHYNEMCYACNATFDCFEKLALHRRRCRKLTYKEPPAVKTFSDVMRPPPTRVYKPAKSTSMSDKKPEQESDKTPEETLDIKPEQESDKTPEETSDIKPEQISDISPNQKSHNPEQISDNNPGQISDNKSEQKSHIKLDEETIKLNCKLCNAIFSHDYYLNIHMEVQHSEISESDNKEKSDFSIENYSNSTDEHTEKLRYSDTEDSNTNDVSNNNKKEDANETRKIVSNSDINRPNINGPSGEENSNDNNKLSGDKCETSSELEELTNDISEFINIKKKKVSDNNELNNEGELHSDKADLSSEYIGVNDKKVNVDSDIQFTDKNDNVNTDNCFKDQGGPSSNTNSNNNSNLHSDIGCVNENDDFNSNNQLKATTDNNTNQDIIGSKDTLIVRSIERLNTDENIDDDSTINNFSEIRISINYDGESVDSSKHVNSLPDSTEDGDTELGNKIINEWKCTTSLDSNSCNTNSNDINSLIESNTAMKEIFDN